VVKKRKLKHQIIFGEPYVVPRDKEKPIKSDFESEVKFVFLQRNQKTEKRKIINEN